MVYTFLKALQFVVVTPCRYVTLHNINHAWNVERYPMSLYVMVIFGLCLLKIPMCRILFLWSIFSCRLKVSNTTTSKSSAESTAPEVSEGPKSSCPEVTCNCLHCLRFESSTKWERCGAVYRCGGLRCHCSPLCDALNVRRCALERVSQAIRGCRGGKKYPWDRSFVLSGETVMVR